MSSDRIVIFADESCQGNCCCEPDYECDYCGSLLGERIAAHNAECADDFSVGGTQ